MVGVKSVMIVEGVYVVFSVVVKPVLTVLVRVNIAMVINVI
tara:strand:- start:1117 stop:1239 length:123 start_codon:yes stop_codon:yes gene_type:complete